MNAVCQLSTGSLAYAASKNTLPASNRLNNRSASGLRKISRIKAFNSIEEIDNHLLRAYIGLRICAGNSRLCCKSR